MDVGSSVDRDGYRLDELGWLQFERLASLVLEAEAGLEDLDWHDRAYRGRVAWVEEEVAVTGVDVRLPGPVAVAVLWVRDARSYASRMAEFGTRLVALSGELDLRSRDQILVVTNLDTDAVGLGRAVSGVPARVAVVGASEVSESLDRHAALRSAMPSVLGLRDLAPLIAEHVRARSSLEIERAQDLARIFVPTRAYERAREVLSRHSFVVLTGPPEMGKTAIAHMIALAQLTTGWEAYDCTSPDQVWRAFDRRRPQVFVADDAFGSTEYRPDAAENWARELGRMLRALDDRHWLIWTSRPAPLRSGLRRVQRERGSERFPAPGEVIVDASDLDLAEKTLILFRHVKGHTARGPVRELVRGAGLTIVEHAHFTPERIRRFVGHRLDVLLTGARHRPWPPGVQSAVVRAVERELATPTQQMANSFRALGEEHRVVLIALLDTPAGLTDERELAATVRRHHPAGLSHPPAELIDRLTDHFLRVSSLGIDWVHPSWRDLVIDELRTDREARRRFLRACGPYGALLVLSQEGGTAGERALPLLVDDVDWDTFTDRVAELLPELEDRDLARLLVAGEAALGADLHAYRRAEVESFVAYGLRAVRRRWDAQRQPLPVFLLEAWYSANAHLRESLEPPQIGATWAELHPASLALRDDVSELRRAEEWLALAQVLGQHDPTSLAALGFPARDDATLTRLVDTARQLIRAPDPSVRSLGEQIVARLGAVAPGHAVQLGSPEALGAPPEDRWWVPEDIAAPPTTERVTPAPSIFTREDVDLVLRDL
jgi:hypothetical protein